MAAEPHSSSRRNGEPEDAGEPVAPAQNGKPEEFQRFEDLARKLAKVPKAELDEKRKTA